MARPSRLYLLAYNSLQTIGWSLALLRLLACLAPPVSVRPAYAAAGDLICFLQTCAVLETVHAAVGLVPTSPFLAFLQWGGRTHFILTLLRQIPEVQDSPSVFITFMAWSISEVIRYSHYALTTLKVCPAWMTYLRYTAFIPLYPIGVGPGEMWTMYQALPFVKERDLHSGFFAKFFMSYHSFLVGVLLCYPLLWLKLYRMCSSSASPSWERWTGRNGHEASRLLGGSCSCGGFDELRSNLLYYLQITGGCLPSEQQLIVTLVADY